MERGVGKVRKALTLLMGHFDPLFFPLPPRFWFRKGSTQGSYFEAISGVFPYPNGSCKKIGFHIELQIYAIGIGWFLLALPPKNRTCEFPRIRLKWLRFELDPNPSLQRANEPLLTLFNEPGKALSKLS